MFTLLAKLFIKDYKNYSDPKVREHYGLLSGGIGVVLNFFLFAGKMAAGILTGAISVIADAFNNLTDAASSVISFIGFKVSVKPTDKEHPFGHGRMEYISGFIVSMLIFMVGFELIKSSIEKIITPEDINFSTLSVVILAVSIVIKLYMFIYNNRTAKAIDSAAMRAVATDSLTDSVATFAVLLSLLLYKFFGWHTDAICGLIVAVFIIFNGYSSAKETVGLLLGKAPDPEYVKEICETVKSHDCIIGVHDLIVHNYGAGRRIISLHAEVDSREDILQAHDQIDNIERELGEKYQCLAVIHMDPVAVGDKKTDELREKVEKIVNDINPEFQVHDFRIVNGNTHTNLIFDVLIPQNCKLTETAISEMIKKQTDKLPGNLNPVCHVERSFTE